MKKLIVNAVTSMLLLVGTIQNYSCTKDAAAPNRISPITNKTPKASQDQLFPRITIVTDTI